MLKGVAGVLAAVLVLFVVGAAVLDRTAPQRHVVGAARPPTWPPNWTVPTWYIDGANVTGCAKDSNTCQSATCTPGTNVGPCARYAEIGARWGTTSPVLRQATQVTWLSDAASSDFVTATVTYVNGGGLTLCGTLTQAASGTLGTVTAKNRAAGQLTNANLGQAVAGFVGFLLQDVTHPAWAWVDAAVSTNVAALTQPMAQQFNPACVAQSSPVYEQDVLQAGDAYVVWRPTQVPIGDLRATAISGVGNNPSQNFWVPLQIAHLWSPSTAGPGLLSSYLPMGTYFMAETRFDSKVVISAESMAQEPFDPWANNRFVGGLQTNDSGYGSEFGAICGGSLGVVGSTPSSVTNASLNFDCDVLIHGYLQTTGNAGLGLAYVDSASPADVLVGLTIIRPILVPGTSALWGPGAITVTAMSTLFYSSSPATQLLQTGGVTLNGSGTACAFDTTVDPSLWHCGRALTNANLAALVDAGGFANAAIDPKVSSVIGLSTN